MRRSYITTLIALICFICFAIIAAHTISRRNFEPLPANVKADRILIEKSGHRLSLFAEDTLLKTYRIALGRGGLDAKQREGDALTPEGRYTISSRNDNSAYHLSLKISYPDPDDIERAQKAGVPPGSDIMIHGLRNGLGWLGPFHHLLDWTQGCVAVTNDEMDELWRAVPVGTPVEIRP